MLEELCVARKYRLIEKTLKRQYDEAVIHYLMADKRFVDNILEFMNKSITGSLDDLEKEIHEWARVLRLIKMVEGEGGAK